MVNRTLLLTGCNFAQSPLGGLTAPLMEAYAKKHQLDFRCVRFNAEGKEAYWQKIIQTLHAFDEGYEVVFWLDADQMITEPDIDPLWVQSGFHASRDWGMDAAGPWDFSMCGYHAHVDTRPAFEWVNERHDQFINGDFPEQTPMRFYFRDNPDKCYLLDRRILNAVPEEVSLGNVPEPWQYGDFSAHLTMIPIEERIALFHTMNEKLKAIRA